MHIEKGRLSIACVCMVLGFMLAIQFRTTQDIRAALPIQRVDVLAAKLQQAEAENKELRNQLEDLQGISGSEKGFEVIKARVPLAELYRYSTSLSSLTSGSATFSMQFADYQPVPGDVQTKLLAEYAAQDTEE